MGRVSGMCSTKIGEVCAILKISSRSKYGSIIQVSLSANHIFYKRDNGSIVKGALDEGLS